MADKPDTSPMTKEDLWAYYCAKNPQFAQDEPVTLTTKGLKKFFEETWRMATKLSEAESDKKVLHMIDAFVKYHGKSIQAEQFVRDFNNRARNN